MKMNRTPDCSASSGCSFLGLPMQTMTICVALMLLVSSVAVVGQEAGSAGSTYSAVVETVQEMNRLLDAAIELAGRGVGGRTTDDKTVVAQGLLNILEGPGSPLFDASLEPPVPIGVGLLPLWEKYVSTVYDPHANPNYDAIVDLVSLPTLISMNDVMIFGAGDFLRLASAAAQVVAAIEGDSEVAWSARNDAFRSAFAHLNAVRGSVGDPYLVTGFLTIAELLPPMVAWVGPGASIQEAIDRLPEGGAIHLEPGIYQETLMIDKSLSLIGSGQGETILQGVDWRISVMIMENSPIEVVISDLTLSGGQGGFLIAGAAQVALDSLEFLSVGVGVHIGETARVVATACRFEGCHTAVSVANTSHCELREGCQIENTPDGSLWTVIVNNSSSLVVSDCTIENNATNGIFLQGDVSLHITDSVIQNNAGYGIGACSPLPGAFTYEEMTESDDEMIITGGGNTIPGADEENPNLRGAVCPLSLNFLTEPLPED